MKKKKKKIPSILLADDIGLEPGREARSEGVKQWAAFLAQRLGSSIDLVNVGDPYLYSLKPYYRPFIERYLSEQKAKLSAIAESIPVRTRMLSATGDPAQVILTLSAKPRSYELIALGTHGRKGVSRFIVGSVAEEVIRNAKVPVLTVGPKAQEDTLHFSSADRLKILVPTALTPNSEPAEEYAFSLAKRLSADVVLFHSLHEALHPVLQNAFSVPGASQEITGFFAELSTDALKRLQSKADKWRQKGTPVAVSLDEKNGSATDAVLAEVQKQRPALIVMGTHGRSLISGAFFGRTVRGVILEAPVPVVTVRSRKT